MSDLYLLDANALIDAHQDFYPLDRIPGFWVWLVRMGDKGRIKIPSEIYDEVAPFRGPLPTWLQQREVRAALVLPERSNLSLVQHVLEVGYAPDLDDVEIEENWQRSVPGRSSPVWPREVRRYARSLEENPDSR